MKKYKDKKQYRLKGYDYSQGGFYFITICTNNRECFFGKIVNGKMKLSEIGLIADKFWQEIPDRFPVMKIDEYIVMPNHVHGIIIINADQRRNAPWRVSTLGIQPLIKNSLSSVVNHFKGNTKRYCNKNNLEFVWQPRFHDHIIRDEGELYRIRQYIVNNPSKWGSDRNNSVDLFM